MCNGFSNNRKSRQEEKYQIINFLDYNNLLDKRLKLVAKYRHESKYLLRNWAYQVPNSHMTNRTYLFDWN